MKVKADEGIVIVGSEFTAKTAEMRVESGLVVRKGGGHNGSGAPETRGSKGTTGVLLGGTGGRFDILADEDVVEDARLSGENGLGENA